MISEQGFEPMLAFINTKVLVAVGRGEQERIVMGNLAGIAVRNPSNGGEGELELLFSDRAPIMIHESIMHAIHIQAIRV